MHDAYGKLNRDISKGGYGFFLDFFYFFFFFNGNGCPHFYFVNALSMLSFPPESLCQCHRIEVLSRDRAEHRQLLLLLGG